MGKSWVSWKWAGAAIAVLAAACAVFLVVRKTDTEKKAADPLFAFGTIPVTNPEEAEDSGWEGQYLWYGNIRWRVLSKDEPEGILLFADSIPMEYEKEWKNQVYQDTEEWFSWYLSGIRVYLNTKFLEEAFTALERAAIVPVTDDEKVEDKLFLLTKEEATETEYGFTFYGASETRSYESPWWLLGSGNSYFTMSYIDADGAIVPKADPKSGDKAIRPAFRLDPSSILFVRDEKLSESQGVSSAMTENSALGETSGEWTALLSSAEQFVTVDSVTVEEEGCVVSYRDASVGEGNYLSAIVTDRDMTKIYSYSRIADTREQGTGTAKIHLPGGLGKDERLMIFSEKASGSHETGYASSPVTVLSAEGGLTESVSSSGTLTGIAPIISLKYDPYLHWTEEIFTGATPEGQLDCGVAALMYEAVLEGRGKLSEADIAGGEQYVKEHEDQILTMVKTRFSVKENENQTLKEIMDASREHQVQEPPKQSLNMGDYESYLDYTGTDYLDGDEEEQRNIIIASMVYLVQVRGGVELDSEGIGRLETMIREGGQDAQKSRDIMEMIFRSAPDKTVRQLLSGQY